MIAQNDRAPAVARYLVEDCKGLAAPAILQGLAERWPGLSRAEFERAYRISKEIVEGRAAEYFAAADALDAEYERRSGRRRDEV